MVHPAQASAAARVDEASLSGNPFARTAAKPTADITRVSGRSDFGTQPRGSLTVLTEGDLVPYHRTLSRTMQVDYHSLNLALAPVLALDLLWCCLWTSIPTLALA